MGWMRITVGYVHDGGAGTYPVVIEMGAVLRKDGTHGSVLGAKIIDVSALGKLLDGV